jgi:hypothetical protein
MPASNTSAGEAEPPPAPIWKRLSTTARAKVGPWVRTNAKNPMNMIRRTSSANQLSSEADWIANQTAAMLISIVARIQNRDFAASMMVVSHPFAADETWFSSSVRTCPSCANAGTA